MKKIVVLGCLVAFLAVPGCKNKKGKTQSAETKEIELVVNKDSKLAMSQEELLRRRGALIRLRKQIREKRAALEAKKRELMAKDPKAAKEIEAQEAALSKKERDLLAQEQTVIKQLDRLFNQRAQLLAKAKEVLAKGGGGAVPDVARREAAVAAREKELAKREEELAKREAAIAKREADIARREKELAKGCAGFAAPSIVIPRIATPSVGGQRFSKGQVESLYAKAMHVLSSKGILVSDLPPAVAQLRSSVRKHLKSKDYAQAGYAAKQLLAFAKAMKVDRAFVAAKIGRLNRRIERAKLSPSKHKKVSRLFTDAVAAYSDGRFRRANSKLNQIAALLK